MSLIRGQQDVPSLHFILTCLTVSSDFSIQGRQWQPLSVHLWVYCNLPTAHDMNDAWCVMPDAWYVMLERKTTPPGKLPLIVSNSSIGSFTSPSIWLVKEGWRRLKANGLTSPPNDAIIWSETRYQITASMISPVSKTLVFGPAWVWIHDSGPSLVRPVLSQLS